MGKKPRVAVEPPDNGKVPRALATASYWELSPIWKFGRLDLDAQWGWRQCGPRLEEIHQKLSHYEKMTFKEILLNDKTGSHHVETYRLCKDAQDRLKSRETDDIDQLLSLRLTGKERIWGIQDSAVVSLLWWDPEHQVCPALKKWT